MSLTEVNIYSLYLYYINIAYKVSTVRFPQLVPVDLKLHVCTVFSIANQVLTFGAC